MTSPGFKSSLSLLVLVCCTKYKFNVEISPCEMQFCHRNVISSVNQGRRRLTTEKLADADLTKDPYLGPDETVELLVLLPNLQVVDVSSQKGSVNTPFTISVQQTQGHCLICAVMTPTKLHLMACNVY